MLSDTSKIFQKFEKILCGFFTLEMRDTKYMIYLTLIPVWTINYKILDILLSLLVSRIAATDNPKTKPSQI